MKVIVIALGLLALSSSTLAAFTAAATAAPGGESIQAVVQQRATFSNDIQAHVVQTGTNKEGDRQTVTHDVKAHLSMQMVKQGAIEAHVHSAGGFASKAQTLIDRNLKSDDEKRVALAKKLQEHLKACKKAMKKADASPSAEQVAETKSMMKECKALYAQLVKMDQEAAAENPAAVHTISHEAAMGGDKVDIKAALTTAAKGELSLTQVKTTKVEGEDAVVKATAVKVSAGVVDQQQVEAHGGQMAAGALQHLSTGKDSDVAQMAAVAGQAEDVRISHKRAVMINGRAARANPKDGSSPEQALASAFRKAAQESQVEQTETKGSQTKKELVQDPKVKQAFLNAAMQQHGNSMAGSARAPARRPAPQELTEEQKAERAEAQKKYRAALRSAIIAHLKRQQEAEAAKAAATKAE